MDSYARAPGLIPCIAFLILFSVLEMYVNYDETAIPGIEDAQRDSESLLRNAHWVSSMKPCHIQAGLTVSICLQTAGRMR
jgi:hypothetical protein